MISTRPSAGRRRTAVCSARSTASAGGPTTGSSAGGSPVPSRSRPVAPFLIEHDAERRGVDAGRARPPGPTSGTRSAAGSGSPVSRSDTGSPAVAAGRLRSLLAAAVEPAGRAASGSASAGHEVRFAAREDRPAALIDLVADVPLRTRTTQIGDCRIRLRGTAAVVGAPPHPEAAPDV